MATFVLVHGGWGGGAWWRKIVPLLTAHGHRVFAPDLPGMGEDYTPVSNLSLAVWADSVATQIIELGDPVILVGHSSGGVVISEVAERIPNRLLALVYLAGFLLQDGESLGDLVRSDPDSIIYANLLIDVADDSSTLRPEAVQPALFTLCSEEDIAFAYSTWRQQPLFGLRSPVSLTPERFGSVARHYIECAKDKAVPLNVQRKMQNVWPCASVTTLDSDHSPFFSMPEKLAGVLTGLAD
jgi:pimeloyl-ACP methyl ester carboxylesterase